MTLKSWLLESYYYFAPFLLHFFYNSLPSRIIIVFELVYIKHLIRVKNEFGNKNEMRQEINVDFISYQTLRYQNISNFVRLRPKRIQSPISKHDITPLSLEHAHDILRLEFISFDRAVEYSLFMALEYGLVFGINKRKLFNNAEPLVIEMGDCPASRFTSNIIIVALLLTRVYLVLRGRVINVV